MSRPSQAVSLAFAIALALAAHGRSATACPICGEPTVTLAERLAKADAAVLVEWVSSQTAGLGQTDSSTYTVVETPRPGDTKLKKGDRVTAPGYHAGKSGDLVFLFGRQREQGEIQWDHPPLDVTEMSYQYIVQAPSPEAAWDKRLAYYARFLEFPDHTIANDAFAEFVNAPAKDIASVADLLPAGKLRRWLFDPKTPVNRIAAYGLMLGLCGQADDVRRMEQKIFDSHEENRVGIEGVMVGYLLLSGEAGLEQLARRKLQKANGDEGDVFAALTALRYLWSYGNGRIAPARLIAAMRLLIDNPTFAESAIKDLSRWKDWELQSRLMELYGAPGYDDRALKKTIIKFLIACTKDVPPDSGKDLPQHVRQAQAHLKGLREREPKLVGETEKFFFLD